MIVVTGSRGSGKSTLLGTAIPILQQKTDVLGVISIPSLDSENRRTGLIATVFPADLHLPLATVVDSSVSPSNDRDRGYSIAAPEYGIIRTSIGGATRYETEQYTSEHDIYLGPYRFFTRSFQRIEETLEMSPGGRSTKGALIIDEIGPIEIRYDRGFASILTAGMERAAPLVVSTRPDLVETIQRRAAAYQRETVVFFVEADEDRGRLIDRFVQVLSNHKVV